MTNKNPKKSKYIYNEKLSRQENKKILKEMDMTADELLQDMNTPIIKIPKSTVTEQAKQAEHTEPTELTGQAETEVILG